MIEKLFFDLEESQVLELRDNAVALIGEGKTIMSVSAGGKSGSKVFPMNPKDVLLEARAALRHINPETYGKRVRKTYASFRRCHF
jgi:hypothetical protein